MTRFEIEQKRAEMLDAVRPPRLIHGDGMWAHIDHYETPSTLRKLIERADKAGVRIAVRSFSGDGMSVLEVGDRHGLTVAHLHHGPRAHISVWVAPILGWQ